MCCWRMTLPANGTGAKAAGARPPASATISASCCRSIPAFRLLIAHGYSDMVTPYSVSQYMLDHLPAIGDPTRAGLRNYRGGHMFYIDANSRRAFSTDAKAFYDGEP